MATEYQTQYWRVRVPDLWLVREVDSQAQVEIRRRDGVGVLKIITTACECERLEVDEIVMQPVAAADTTVGSSRPG